MLRALTCSLLLLATLGAGFTCETPTREEACRGSTVCVDCGAVCERMRHCQVTFAVDDPPVVGELLPDDDQARCERACLSTDTITSERQECILDADASDLTRCQREVVACLGVDGGVPE